MHLASDADWRKQSGLLAALLPSILFLIIIAILAAAIFWWWRKKQQSNSNKVNNIDVTPSKDSNVKQGIHYFIMDCGPMQVHIKFNRVTLLFVSCTYIRAVPELHTLIILSHSVQFPLDSKFAYEPR